MYITPCANIVQYYYKQKQKQSMSALANVEPMPQVAHSTDNSQAMSGATTNNMQQQVQTAPVQMSAKKAQGKTYSRRVLISSTCTAAELAAGKIVNIPESDKIFQPDWNHKSDTESVKELSALDTSKGIITQVDVMSIYSNAPSPVVLGMKLFTRPGSTKEANCSDLKITNEAGWLYSTCKNSLGESASNTRGGITSLFAIQPFERARVPTGQVVYKPSNVIGNRYIQEYGQYNWKNLWNNIVQFPNESFYYVSKDHVILKVIENNWELLGLDIRSEIPREGKYVKVSCAVADRVIKELYDNVISRIPFSSFKNLKAVFSSDSIDETSSKSYNLSVELRVSFVYPAMGAAESVQQ